MSNYSINLKLESGLELLDEWAARARQTAKNHLYKALFAITDGSVYHRYGVLQDQENPNAHFVLVRDDLVLKVNYQSRESFGILFIGPLASAPGLDLALEAG
jgi:hypothetical protein